jgi:hypothetical protein
MTISRAREKLHDLVDQADEVKILELLSFFEQNVNKSKDLYDETTINMLKQRSADYLSCKSKTFSTEESMEHIRLYRT